MQTIDNKRFNIYGQASVYLSILAIYLLGLAAKQIPVPVEAGLSTYFTVLFIIIIM